ncbi:MAG TPA: sigma-54-dependent Fis family transcriptional regulator [Gammaproteobacteria bacterium]|nr:sigma-54-dependent Fis family transcriptional regulator [Gammaproteobacteria bacterium]
MNGVGSAHAQKVVACVERFRGDDTDAGLEKLVIQSWQRCLHDHQLHPGDSIRSAVLDSGGVRERREQMGELYHIARTEMQNLYDQTAGSGYAVLLTDATGTIVHRVGDPTLDREFAAAGLWAGADWTESCAGTNGMGTCLVERRPITIHRGDHFLDSHTTLSCSASPILDPHGELLAVLDVSSARCRDARESQMHAVALVTMSARLVENCNFLRVYRDSWVLRFHVRSEFVGLLTEGMLAIDADGTVNAANPSAVTQLGMGSRADLVGRPVDEILELPCNLIRDRESRPDHSVWPVRDLKHGKRYFATLRGPVIRRRGPRIHSSGHGRVIHPLMPAHDDKAYTLRALMSGGDPRMAYNVRCAERLVDKNVSILLYGETGTGKEAMARAIHAASARSDAPFVAVNCASIPESLIESELFGYRAGAFTGARRDGMRGKIRQSSGGTLFLDEIGDMPAELQTRLLRVLEEQEILPLGCETPIPVDLHVISATHRDLPALVKQELFRDDLYYRLNGVSLTLPPLRERRDRETVIRNVLGEECQGGQEVGIHPDAFEKLMSYNWPGNIRQMRNCLRTTLALCDDGIIRLADLPTEIVRETDEGRVAASTREEGDDVAAAGQEASRGNPLASAERQTLLEELERHHWNITITAATLSVSRNTIYRKMKKHGIEFSEHRPGGV